MFLAYLHEIWIPWCRHCKRASDAGSQIRLENQMQNQNKIKEMWKKCAHKNVSGYLWISTTHRTALRSLKPYRMHVKIPCFALILSVCIPYMWVFISWGLVTTSRFRNNGPRADILHMDRCDEKTSYPLFLSSSFSLFPLFPFVSLYFSKHHISPYSPLSLIFDQQDCAPFS